MGNDDGSPDDLSPERRLPLRSGRESPGTDGDGNSAAAAEVGSAACSCAMAQGGSGAARDHAGAGRNASDRFRAGSRAAGMFGERILRPCAGATSAASAVWQDGPLGLDAMGVPARRSSPETVWAIAQAGEPLARPMADASKVIAPPSADDFQERDQSQSVQMEKPRWLARLFDAAR